MILFGIFERYFDRLYSGDCINITGLMGIFDLWNLDRPYSLVVVHYGRKDFFNFSIYVLFCTHFFYYIVVLFRFVFVGSDLRILYVLWSFNKSVIFGICNICFIWIYYNSLSVIFEELFGSFYVAMELFPIGSLFFLSNCFSLLFHWPSCFNVFFWLELIWSVMFSVSIYQKIEL